MTKAGLARATAQKVADIEQNLTSTQLAYCDSIDWANRVAMVIVSQGRVPAQMVGAAPIPGRKCRVAWLGDALVCLGVDPRSSTGKVTSGASGGVVGFLGDDGVQYSVAYDNTLTFAVNDRIAVEWTSTGGLAYAKLSADPVTLDPYAPPPPVVVPGGPKSLTFIPNDSGTYYQPGGTWQTSDVWCTDTNLGAWFYSGIAATIGDGDQITAIRVYVDAYQTEGAAPTIGLHALSGKSGAPNVVNAVQVPAGTGWKNLPLSFGDLLKTGAQLGLGTNHGGYHKWSRARVNNSGALYIAWRT